MSASSVFFLLFLLACPLMMVLMMLSGHGHGRGTVGPGGGCHDDHVHESQPRETSIQDLRRQRAELDRLIDQRERAEPAKAGQELGSWRRGRR